MAAADEASVTAGEGRVELEVSGRQGALERDVAETRTTTARSTWTSSCLMIGRDAGAGHTTAHDVHTIALDSHSPATQPLSRLCRQFGGRGSRVACDVVWRSCHAHAMARACTWTWVCGGCPGRRTTNVFRLAYVAVWPRCASCDATGVFALARIPCYRTVQGLYSTLYVTALYCNTYGLTLNSIRLIYLR